MRPEEQEIAKEAAIHNAYVALDVSNENELKDEKYGRSIFNIRRSVELFIKWASEQGLNPEDVVAQLVAEAEKTKEFLTLVYYQNIAATSAVIESGGIKNLFEFSEEEGNKKKKPSETNLDSALFKRREVDKVLGWDDPEMIYHLAVESEGEGKEVSSNYGSVRFKFDFAELGPDSTFTEGDSLNPNHLPAAIFEKNHGLGEQSKILESIKRRQITADHVHIAKTIFSLATKMEKRIPGTAIFLRYIEAQVHSADLGSHIKEVSIDLKGAAEEFYLDSYSVDEIRQLARKKMEDKIKEIEGWCKTRGIKFVVN